MSEKIPTVRLYAVACKDIGLIDGTASQYRKYAIQNMINVNADYNWKDLKRAGYYVVTGIFRYHK